MKNKVSVGLIGAGRIGKVHAHNLAFMLPEANLAGIADADLEAAKRCAEKSGLQQHVTSKYQDLIENPDIQALVVCSPTDTHAQIIEECARAGKHIFCEKPIDHDLRRIDRALAAVDKAQVKLQVGFNRRFDPNFSAVRQAVASARIGEPHILSITSRDPAPPPIEYVKVSGGLFLDMMIHDFDMARFLIASEVKSVYALGSVRIDEEIGKAGDIDTALVTLEFDNGVIATINNSREAAYGYDQRVEVFGSGGAVYTENNSANRTIVSDTQGVHSPLPLNFFMQRYTESYLIEMRAFLSAVLSDTPPPVSGHDGRVAVLIGLAAKESLSCKQVVLVKDMDASLLQQA